MAGFVCGRYTHTDGHSLCTHASRPSSPAATKISTRFCSLATYYYYYYLVILYSPPLLSSQWIPPPPRPPRRHYLLLVAVIVVVCLNDSSRLWGKLVFSVYVMNGGCGNEHFYHDGCCVRHSKTSCTLTNYSSRVVYTW